MVRRRARRLYRIETDVKVENILSKPWRKVKFVTFLNDLESLRDLLMRVLHVACIELWGAWGTTGATSDDKATHPPLMVCCVQGEWLSLPL